MNLCETCWNTVELKNCGKKSENIDKYLQNICVYSRFKYSKLCILESLTVKHIIECFVLFFFSLVFFNSISSILLDIMCHLIN